MPPNFWVWIAIAFVTGLATVHTWLGRRARSGLNRCGRVLLDIGFALGWSGIAFLISEVLTGGTLDVWLLVIAGPLLVEIPMQIVCSFRCFNVEPYAPSLELSKTLTTAAPQGLEPVEEVSA